MISNLVIREILVTRFHLPFPFMLRDIFREKLSEIHTLFCPGYNSFSTDRENFSLGQLLPKYKYTGQNNKLEPKKNFNTSCHSAKWSSVLECQEGINLAICASAFLDEVVSKSSGVEKSSLSEGNSSNCSNSSSSDSTSLSLSGSSGTGSEMPEVSSVDSTSTIDNLLAIVS